MAGDRLGKTIGAHIVNAIIQSSTAKLPHETEYKQRAETAKYERWEKELSPIVTKLLHSMGISSKNTEGPLSDILAMLENPTHQVQVLPLILALVGIVIDVPRAAAVPFAQAASNLVWKTHPNKPLSAADAAVAVVKGWLDQPAAFSHAESSGYNEGAFQTMVDITGSPPGPQELLYMLRRGIIDEATFAKGIKEGLTRPEWTDQLLALEYSPPSAAEAIQALVQNQVDSGTAQKWAAESGLDPNAFDAMYRTAGNPPGPMETLELFNRGIFSDSQVSQALSESRLKDKYIQSLKTLAVKLIPLFETRTILAAGGMSDEDATTNLLKQGYPANYVADIVKSAHATKTATVREATKAEFLKAYQEQLITAGDVQTSLELLGYHPDSIQLELALADHQKEYAMQNAAISVIRSKYVAHKLTRQQAGSALDSLQIPSPAVSQYLAIWDIELAANIKTLTLAEVGAMAKNQIIYQTEFTQRLTDMGYNPTDIGLLGELYLVQPDPTGG